MIKMVEDIIRFFSEFGRFRKKYSTIACVLVMIKTMKDILIINRNL